MDGTEIVAALRDRDPAGLAAVYDAYADRLLSFCVGMLRDRDAAADAVHDTFVVAYERAHQLRDPERLRPWLYAIARNECLRAIRNRARTTELDEADAVSETTTAMDAGMRDEELRRLVWAAAEGLNPREREVLDLAVRHDLEMTEVAGALGVPTKHAHALLSKARQQLERAVGALIVARTGRGDCAELDGLLAGWDGGLTVLLRKRVSRHIDSCPTCDGRKRRDVNAQALFAATPLLVAPAALRDRILATGSATELDDWRAEIATRAGRFDRHGFPVPLDRGGGRPGGLRPAPAAAALAIAAVVVGGTFIADQRLGGAVVEAPPVPAVSPSQTEVVEPVVDATPVAPTQAPSTPSGTAPPPERPTVTTAPTRRPTVVPTPTPTQRLPTPTMTAVTPTVDPTPLPTLVPLPPVIIRPPESTRVPTRTPEPPPVP